MNCGASQLNAIYHGDEACGRSMASCGFSCMLLSIVVPHWKYSVYLCWNC
jgi:hypothetical protein